MSNVNKNNEEVDLGSLFVIIGKGFTKLFNFLGNILKGVFNFLIQILLFLKANLFKIGVAALVGGLIGFFIHLNSKTKFEANLQVQPNFKSARQLYNNINYYNDLVKQKDTVLLAKTFNISTNDAASIKKFEVTPIINENDIITAYDELIEAIDTTAVKQYSYDSFKNTFTGYDYNIHNVRVVATKNNVFSKLDETIIASITENNFFKNLKQLNQENLNRTDLLIRKNLSQADSLHYIYKKVLLEEAKKMSSGTNIDLGNGKNSVSKELSLFETNRELNADLKKVNEDLSEKSEIVNIISNFQPVGHEIKELHTKWYIQLAALGALGMILFLLLQKLNNYLNNYQK